MRWPFVWEKPFVVELLSCPILK